MRPLYRYHPDQHKYEEQLINYKSSLISKADLIQKIDRDERTSCEPKSLFDKFDIQENEKIDGLLHTMASARMILDRMRVVYEEVDLWLEDGVEVDNVLRFERGAKKAQIIGNLFPKSEEWKFRDNKKIPSLVWRSYKYNDTIREYIVPIPPLYSADQHPPFIEDEEWNELVSFSRLWYDYQTWTSVPSDVDMYKEMELDSLPFLSAYNAEKRVDFNGDILSDVSVTFLKHRRFFAVEFMLMGILDCDDVYEKFLPVNSKENSKSRKITLRHDPRAYWEGDDLCDPFYKGSAKGRLRNKIRRLAWLAYQAGREKERCLIAEEKRDILNLGKLMKDTQVQPGKPKNLRNEIFIDAAKDYHERHDRWPTGAKLRDHINDSQNIEWISALNELGKNSQQNIINGILRRLKKSAK